MFHGANFQVDLPDLEPIAAIFPLPPLRGALAGRAKFSESVGTPPAGSLEVSGPRHRRRRPPRRRHTSSRPTARRARLDAGGAQGRPRRGSPARAGPSYDFEQGSAGRRRGGSRPRGRGALSRGVRAPQFMPDPSGETSRVAASRRRLPGAPLVIEAEFSEGRVGSMQRVQEYALKRRSTCRAAAATPHCHGLPLAAKVPRRRTPGGKTRASDPKPAARPARLRVGALEISRSRRRT